MAQTFDTIFRSGIVVNQDGVGLRDIGIADGRIAAIGNLLRMSDSPAWFVEPRRSGNPATPACLTEKHRSAGKPSPAAGDPGGRAIDSP